VSDDENAGWSEGRRAVLTPWSRLGIVWTREMVIESADIPELLPGTLYMLVLRALARGPLHGYAIARRIKDSSSSALEIEDGSLYPALNRMLVKGWLKAEWGVSENNRRARFYTLTADGRKQLERETKQFEKLVMAIQRVMRTA
jgi:PadR family transcriptional regulator, regulatory protein PadR